MYLCKEQYIMDLLMLILFIIGSVGLSFEIEDSHLSNTIKGWLGLDRERNWMIKLSKIQNYWKQFGWWTVVFFLIIFPIIVVLQFLRLIITGLSCSTCLTFQITFWTTLFILGYPLATALMVAGVAIIINRFVYKYTF